MQKVLLCTFLALLFASTSAQTCSRFFRTGQVPTCVTNDFPSFNKPLGAVTHKFVSRNGRFRDIITAPRGFRVNSISGGAFTVDQGQLTRGELPRSATFATSRRQAATVYNPRSIAASSNCCGGGLFLYTWARICQTQGSRCFTVGVRKRRFRFPCDSPCAGRSGTVVEFGSGTECPSCRTSMGGGLQLCSRRCKIDCAKPQSAVTAIMSANCRDDKTGRERTCACPPFDATIETDNANCVMDIVRPTATIDRINFGVLENVGFYRVTTPPAPASLPDGYKIEFEEDVTNSTFCELKMSGSLEIRRGFFNSFVGSTSAERNLRIVDWAKLRNSVFGPMSFFNAFIEEGVEIVNCVFEEWNSRDNVNFKAQPACGPPATCSTPIKRNTFNNITAVKNCASKFTPDVARNTFGVFDFAGTTRGCDSIGFGPR